MPPDEIEFLRYSLEELHEYLKDELRRNPYVDVSENDRQKLSDGEGPPSPPADSSPPNEP